MAALNTHSSKNPSSKLLSFEHLGVSGNSESRLGHLRFRNRTPIDTPHYVAVSSRGAVPHLSQDTMRNSTSIKGMYAALEDCEYSMVRCKVKQHCRPRLTCVLSLEPASHRESLPSIANAACLQRSSLS